MKGFFFRLVITGLGLWVAETIVPGVRIDGWGNLVVAALLLGIVNAVIRPIILILTLPLTVLTLGLFILVVNGISVALVAWLMPGFALAGLWAAILTSIVVGLTSWFASAFVGGSGRIERYRRIEVTGRRLDSWSDGRPDPPGVAHPARARRLVCGRQCVHRRPFGRRLRVPPPTGRAPAAGSAVVRRLRWRDWRPLAAVCDLRPDPVRPAGATQPAVHQGPVGGRQRGAVRLVSGSGVSSRRPLDPRGAGRRRRRPAAAEQLPAFEHQPRAARARGPRHRRPRARTGDACGTLDWRGHGAQGLSRSHFSLLSHAGPLAAAGGGRHGRGRAHVSRGDPRGIRRRRQRIGLCALGADRQEHSGAGRPVDRRTRGALGWERHHGRDPGSAR